MRSPVTGLVEQFNSLTEVEQKVFLDLVDPQLEPEPPAKQTRKKRTTKSARASGMAAAIKNSLEAGQQAVAEGDKWRCAYRGEGDAANCGEAKSSLVHDHAGGYAHYHPFEPSAPVATRRSSRKGVVASSTPNSETGSDAALAASSAGD